MLTTIEGVFRNGQIELREMPKNIQNARVIVTFLAEAEATLEELRPSAEAMPEELRPGRTAWEHLDDEELSDPQPHPASGVPATLAERIQALRSMVASLPEAPVVPLEAFDRENLYR